MNTIRSSRHWPTILCWAVVALDGFDLVVLGTVIPTLLGTGELGFDPAAATLIATLGLVGVGLGAFLVGPLTDTYGRRRPILACVLVFSVCTLAIAAAPSILVFGILRFVAGLGLGACLPTAIAYVGEFTPASRSGRAVTLTMTGYHVGAVLTALLALVIIPDWRLMFIIGGIAGLIVLPMLWLALPESETFRAGPRGTVRRAPTGAPRELLRKRYLGLNVSIWSASFMGLLLVYGLNTWLPELMRAAGYDLGNSLAFLMVLNVGAVAGLVLAGVVGDRFGIRRIAVTWFVLAAGFLAVLSIRTDQVVVLYVAVFITGVFVFSAQVLVYAYVNGAYPPSVRGTALGFSAGIGRAGAIVGPLITGGLVGLGVAYPWGFYAFSLAALIAVVALSAIPGRRSVGAGSEPAPADSMSEVQGSSLTQQ
jgi:MFS family permease